MIEQEKNNATPDGDIFFCVANSFISSQYAFCQHDIRLCELDPNRLTLAVAVK